MSRSRLGWRLAATNVVLLEKMVAAGVVGGSRRSWKRGATLPPTTWTESLQVRRLAFIFIKLRDKSLQFIRWNTFNTAACKHVLSWDMSRSRLGWGLAATNVVLLEKMVAAGVVGGSRRSWKRGATLPPTTWTESLQVRRLAFIFIKLRDKSLQFIRWNTFNTAACKHVLSWDMSRSRLPLFKQLRENHLQASPCSCRNIHSVS